MKIRIQVTHTKLDLNSSNFSYLLIYEFVMMSTQPLTRSLSKLADIGDVNVVAIMNGQIN